MECAYSCCFIFLMYVVNPTSPHPAPPPSPSLFSAHYPSTMKLVWFYCFVFTSLSPLVVFVVVVVVFVFFFFFFFGQSGGASRWRVCYQQGLPRLVLYSFLSYNTDTIFHLRSSCIHRFNHTNETKNYFSNFKVSFLVQARIFVISFE